MVSVHIGAELVDLSLYFTDTLFETNLHFQIIDAALQFADHFTSHFGIDFHFVPSDLKLFGRHYPRLLRSRRRSLDVFVNQRRRCALSLLPPVLKFSLGLIVGCDGGLNYAPGDLIDDPDLKDVACAIETFPRYCLN
jgi:hypothetical protein